MRAFRNPTLLAQGIPWTCRSCLRKQKVSGAGKSNYTSKAGSGTVYTPRRKNVALAAASGTLGASVALFTDDVKHGYMAVERSGRVLTTLAVCMNEWVSISISSPGP